MSYLNPPYENSFKELCAAMPLYYLDVFEMRAILKADGRLLDDVEASFEQAFLNNFILKADAATISVWENILGITYREKLTLDQRKSVVIGRLYGNTHIGEPEIRDIISNYTGNSVYIDFKSGVIYITIEGEIFGEDNLLDTLLQRIPAHLRLNMGVHVRRTFRQILSVSFSGAVGSQFHTQPISENRRAAYRIPVGYGESVQARFHTQPVGKDRSAAHNMPVRYGESMQALFNAQPIGKDRSAACQLPVGYGEALQIQMDGTPPAVNSVSTGSAEVTGGMFCYTRTKSRLIE